MTSLVSFHIDVRGRLSLLEKPAAQTEIGAEWLSGPADIKGSCYIRSYIILLRKNDPWGGSFVGWPVAKTRSAATPQNLKEGITKFAQNKV